MARWRRTAVVAGLAVAAALGLTAIAGAQSLPDLDLGDPPAELCSTVFAADAFEGFLPDGEVAPGERVRLTVEWQTGNVDDDKVDILGCVAVDGEPAGALATLGRQVDNDGEHHLTFLLPDDLAAGVKVCERSAVIDSGSDITRTSATCWSVTPAPGSAVAAPSEKAAGPELAEAAPGPEAASADGAPEAGSEPVVAGTVEERGAANLPRTGSGSRPLGALAGVALLLGGLAVALGAPGARKVA